MIEVGDFVRTKQGKIAKLIEVSKNNYYWFDNWIYKESGIPHQGFRIEDTERIGIVKHSKNIIDLLEEGDIVNGFSISKFDNEDGNEFLAIPIYNDAQLGCIEEVRPIATIKIKAILTHEQYMQNCYTVERKKVC